MSRLKPFTAADVQAITRRTPQQQLEDREAALHGFAAEIDRLITGHEFSAAAMKARDLAAALERTNDLANRLADQER